MNKIKIFLVFMGLFFVLNLSAQNMSDIRLNEVLKYNVSDFQDDFGQHNSWFELFNTSYGTVNIGGCFISNDPNNLQMYHIPKADILTKIKPRQHILFWADNQPFRGTFHINFDLKNSKEIILTSSDGRTIIDRISIPTQIDTNVSYGRTIDGKGSIDGTGEGWAIMKNTSPSTNNYGVDSESKNSIMARTDPYGIIMALTAMTVVFIALILLYLVFKNIGKYSIRKSQTKSSNINSTKLVKTKFEEIPAETYAAIAMALHLYNVENEAHDTESFLITMEHPDRKYSPWSSKIYSLRQTPQIKK
ncbi:MAG: OadG family transporter subunit [Bacteroidales bacterium]|jgi:Na+-transporting methylmalonyl-CoA/oxaloacetate decarboxylase gamma subunit